ncbi:MAG TPA: methyltransferase domain-containing protein [Gammaproteobacteria bacterium]|nr:methyltransferase domain-containing protein [Gammaproteobacteria bacterium]
MAAKAQSRKGRPCTDRAGLREWYAGALGQRVLETEHRLLAEVLPDLFGYHLVQVGQPVSEDLLQSSRISHRVVVEEATVDTPPMSGVRGRADALPLQRDSVDVLLLPHTLEFAAHPHEVLREAERVLVAEGHLVILGFNPWSLWGLWRLLRGRGGRPPWCGNFRSLLKLRDWLALLGFDIVMTRMYCYRPPLSNAALMGRLGFLECLGRRWWPVLGGAYVLVARKRVVGLTPIRPRWRPRRRRLVQVDLARRTPVSRHRGQ